MKRTFRFALYCTLLLIAQMVSPSFAEQSAPTDDFKITILSTMLADRIQDEAYSSVGEWGFSALIEVTGKKYLYDTGYHPDLVLRNAKKLGIDLTTVKHVILSHHHIDHIGGLLTLRRTLMQSNSEAMSVVHIAQGFFAKPDDPDNSGRDEATAIIDVFRDTGGKVVIHDRPSEIASGIWLSGPVPRKHEERNWSGNAHVIWKGNVVTDFIPEDMSLIIQSSNGLVVISGCGHAGIVNIADHALEFTGENRVVAAIGGFHLFEASDETLTWTASQFKRIGLVNFIGAHCTGIEAAFRLRQLAGLSRSNAVVGAVGQRYTLRGIDVGRIAQ